jgi:Condensation domain
LFRVRPDEHFLLMTMHHIAVDGWSGRILNLELSSAYAAHLAGRDTDLPPLPIQYADFAAWQRSHLQGAVLDDLLRYWSAELEAVPPRLRLPTDRARPEVQLHRGRHLPLRIEGTPAAAVRRLSREEAATAYMVLLSAFGVLLYRFTGQDDVVVGTPVANRNHVEVENLIGLFSNTVVVRTRLAGNPTFRDLVGRVRESVVGAYQHQELPFETLVQRLKVSRDPGYNPLFQVNFRANAAASETLDFPGLTVTQESVDIGFSRFDLALELRLETESVTGYLEYDEELFEEATIEGLAADLETVLLTVADDPDRRILTFPSPKKPRARAAAIPRASN